MCFITIEDDTGKLEGVVFPRLFAETKFFWESDRILIFEVKIESREDKLSLIVDKVWSIDQTEIIPAFEENRTRVQPNGAGFNRWPRKGEEADTPRIRIAASDYNIIDDTPLKPADMIADRTRAKHTEVKLTRSADGSIEVLVPPGTTKEKLAELAMILREHKGDDKMALLVPNGDPEPKRIEVPYGIRYGIELRELVENLFLT
jgi:hypothetical protein